MNYKLNYSECSIFFIQIQLKYESTNNISNLFTELSNQVTLFQLLHVTELNLIIYGTTCTFTLDLYLK